jgi:hypothetical protein
MVSNEEGECEHGRRNVSTNVRLHARIGTKSNLMALGILTRALRTASNALALSAKLLGPAQSAPEAKREIL